MPEGISIVGRRFNIDSNNPSPALDNGAQQWVYVPTQDRVMYTTSGARVAYTFNVPPSQFELQGFGAEISELKRPYSIPIADITGGKLRRLSFQFPIVKKVVATTTSASRPSGFALRETTDEFVSQNINNPTFTAPVINTATANWFYYDGFSNSVEDQILRLKTIADLGVPVGFENMSASIQETSWHIDDMKFTIQRDDATGNAVAGTCSISCVEFRNIRQRFILLPRFRYGVPDGPAKKAKQKAIDELLSTGKLYWLRKALQSQIKENRANGVAGYPYSVETLRRQLGIPAYINVPASLVKELQK